MIRTQIERVGGVALAQQMADMCVTPVSIDPDAEAAAGAGDNDSDSEAG